MNNIGAYQTLIISQKVPDGFVLTDDDNLTYFMSENEANATWAAVSYTHLDVYKRQV